MEGASLVFALHVFFAGRHGFSSSSQLDNWLTRMGVWTLGKTEGRHGTMMCMRAEESWVARMGVRTPGMSKEKEKSNRLVKAGVRTPGKTEGREKKGWLVKAGVRAPEKEEKVGPAPHSV